MHPSIDEQFEKALNSFQRKIGRGFQAALCRETGITSSHMSEVFSGTKSLSEEKRRAVVDAINKITNKNMSYDDFLEIGWKSMRYGESDDDNIIDISDYISKYTDNLEMLDRIKEWVVSMEKATPGFTTWFAIEFRNRFPEFNNKEAK